MNELKAFCEGVALPLALSLLGGVAKAASQGVRSWRHFVASLIVSGFAGVIVHLFIQEAKLSPSMNAALVGLSGYSGVVVLDGLSAWLQKTLERLGGNLTGGGRR